MTKNFMVARWVSETEPGAARVDVLIFAFPSEIIELAEGEQHHGGAGQEGNEAQGAPEYRRAARRVAGCGIIREIIRIGIGLPGRFATDAQAAQAKKAVSCRSSFGSLMCLTRRPRFNAGREK